MRGCATMQRPSKNLGIPSQFIQIYRGVDLTDAVKLTMSARASRSQLAPEVAAGAHQIQVVVESDRIDALFDKRPAALFHRDE